MQNGVALYNGTEIRRDAEGRVSLTDLWRASGSNEHQAPNRWQRTDAAQAFVRATEKFLKGISNPIIKTKKGKGGGTYAHEQVALEYAQYLSPEFAVSVNQVFFDRIEEEKNPDLILDRAVATYKKRGKSDEWISKRLKSKSTRNILTGTLKLAGCDQHGYRLCTNAMYAPQYGGDAGLVRKKLGLKEGANCREGMTEVQLSTIELTELISAQNIKEKGLYGNNACVQECNTVSRGIAKAVKEAMKNAA